MKEHVKRFALFAALVLALAACPQNAGDGEDDAIPALTGTVSITGNEAIGQELTADTSALDGTGAESYQWYRENVPVIGKTEKIYTPVEADRGKTLLVKVSRAGYTGTVSSPPTGKIDYYIEGKKNLNVSVAPNAAKFYSLTTGLEVNNPASTDWDIGFAISGDNVIVGGRNILTNSGDTATQYATGGNGGIYPTGLTDFAAVTLADKKETYDGFDLSPYHTDKKRWVSTMGKAEATLNVAGYTGYSNETNPSAGTEETPLSGLSYDKFCFWKMPTMGEIVPTNQVYIVRHADDVSYSALQIQAFSYVYTGDNPGETYTVVVRPLEP